MYVPDTLKRINNAAVDHYFEALGDQTEKLENDASWAKCFEAHHLDPAEDDAADLLGALVEDGIESEDYSLVECDNCSKAATYGEEVFNPADTVREGMTLEPYTLLFGCQECLDSGALDEEMFYCTACGRKFIYNHSWDVVAVTDPETGELYCQRCFVEECLEPRPLYELLEELAEGRADGWVRLDNVPGRELLYQGGFSQYSDFPGDTRLQDLVFRIKEAADALGLDDDTPVYPVILAGRQFHVELGVFY